MTPFSEDQAIPFLKWAGGKRQLLLEFEKRLPASIKEKKVLEGYVEPFLGGGALFFFFKGHFHLKKAYLFDINRELIIGYEVIKNDAKKLLLELKDLQEAFYSKGEEERKELYYQIRSLYNDQLHHFHYDSYAKDWIKRASYLIFLNRTCFNGLFRLNRKGAFNVPYGRYKKPTIYDAKNILLVQKALEDTQIIQGDFTKARDYIQRGTFVYLDPPFRPLSKTASFTSYNGEIFDDKEQFRLYEFFLEMHERGAYLMLSNSDPKNIVKKDTFFDDLYQDFFIERVKAKRNINRDPEKRGTINELIIRNFL